MFRFSTIPANRYLGIGTTPGFLHLEKLLALRGEIEHASFLIEDRRGRVPGDLMACGPGYLIRRRALEALEGEGLTGFRRFQVTAEGAGSDVLAEYVGLSIVGRCRTVGVDQSEVWWQRGPKGWSAVWRLEVDLTGWNGSDFFMGRNEDASHVLVTARAVRAIRTLRLTNVALTPVDSVALLAHGRARGFVPEGGSPPGRLFGGG